MVYSASMKLHLIETLIKENNIQVLKKAEKILIASGLVPTSKFTAFSNKLSAEELDAFEKNIEDGCE
jgi:hypothetical protein